MLASWTPSSTQDIARGRYSRFATPQFHHLPSFVPPPAPRQRRAGAPTTAASRATADACGAIIRGGEPGGRLPHWAQPGDVPGSSRRAVAIRTWCTLQRMMPDDTTDFQYRWLTEVVLLVGEIATTVSGNGRAGYIAWCESLGVELRLNRAVSRYTPNHGPLDLPHFVKFLASESGINPIEFNDMLPFVAEACYVNIQLADEVDRSQAVLDSIASHVLQDGGRWPQGLPGPSYWAASSQDSKWFYAAPPLPGSDQVLLGHRNPPTRIDAIADPNFIYAPNDAEQYREMADASKEAAKQPEGEAASTVDNPSATRDEGKTLAVLAADANVPKDDLAQHLPGPGEGDGQETANVQIAKA
ncbi:hypothetical protein EV714DRAFT_275399 [Schizophyllum commune]